MNMDERMDRVEAGLERLRERHEALTRTVEMIGHEVQNLLDTIRYDSENIRALAQVAEMWLKGGERQ